MSSNSLRELCHSRSRFRRSGERVIGPERYYACGLTADGNDLAELLVRMAWREFTEHARRFQTTETRGNIWLRIRRWNSGRNLWTWRLGTMSGTSARPKCRGRNNFSRGCACGKSILATGTLAAEKIPFHLGKVNCSFGLDAGKCAPSKGRIRAPKGHPIALCVAVLSRAGGIRTRDLLNPIQAHYQAVLRPVCASTIGCPSSACQAKFCRMLAREATH